MLRRDRVLYIGETSQAGGMRERMREYLHPNPASIKTTHKAALFLQDYKMRNPSQPIFVRWAPLEANKRTLRDVEAALIQTYNAWFNSRDWSADTPFDTDKP